MPLLLDVGRKDQTFGELCLWVTCETLSLEGSGELLSSRAIAQALGPWLAASRAPSLLILMCSGGSKLFLRLVMHS